MSHNKSAIVFSLAIVAASFLLGRAYVDRKKLEGSIQVTGLGSADFTADLIVWEGKYSTASYRLKDAYAQLKANQQTVEKYLKSKGFEEKSLLFSAVETIQKNKTMYGANGNYIGQEFDGYQLSQTVHIESQNVEQVEKTAREITDLLDAGVQLYSLPPRYYYTKLSDLKIEMISRATEDARLRAEKIAHNSGGKLGKLLSAKMGVFQITAQNSSEDYSWSGTHNTSSKDKTASITMKLTYQSK